MKLPWQAVLWLDYGNRELKEVLKRKQGLVVRLESVLKELNAEPERPLQALYSQLERLRARDPS